ncbi:TrbI/VirB10 family protein [Stutzerimonas stutzeri]|uniref:TrbI/VirB10 family protein n=1 Tax=Stutzerimonas stutzeri TaxID=316 RepID=UPI00210D3E64|nr:TrbI/VirB10 family protein [Stutzerimonas stutzeri]MCQ4258188.1 conjugal transfer protein TrbI [Stutzerimonas stutzeri]
MVSKSDDSPPGDAQAMPPKVAPETLELRARPPRVTRLNPRTLAAIVGGLAAALLGALLWSLQPQHRAKIAARDELFNVERIPRSEGLERLPADYTQLDPTPAPVPQLGPPLPGDVGAAIVKVQDQALVSGDAAKADNNTEELRLARLREAEDAVRSPIFFGVGGSNAPGDRRSGLAANGLDRGAHPVRTEAGTALASRQDPNEPFTSNSANAQKRDSGFVQLPVSPYQLMAGTVIAAALVTGIKSDLPGEVIATVTEPVYDSATGEHLLIPQGSRLLGRYNSQVSYGQRRVQVVWQRVIFPDTTSVQLDNLVGTDAAGYSGLEDGVDWHWDRIVAGAAMSSMLGIGAELAAPQSRSDSDRVIIAGRDGLQDTVNQVGQQMTQRNLDIKPTLTQRPGLPLRVIVNRDMVLHPFPEAFGERTDPPLTEGNVR